MRVLRRLVPVVAAVAAALCAMPSAAQYAPQPAGTPEIRAGIDRLDILDGEWAGPASSMGPGGARIDMVQTERVGDLAGGSLKLVEGRGYTADGQTAFNAFAVITFNPATGKYLFTTFVDGQKHDFPLTVTADGFSWERPAGPNAVVRFTATVKDGKWREVGEYIAAGQPPRQMIELNLKRLGDSRWPLGDPVDPSRAH